MREWWRALNSTARLMVGVKDYDRYVASRRRFSPDAPVMTREEFFRFCQEERYGGKSMKKCPC
ncbi:CstA-like transporter-associated (seleno)protein [uncultured Aquitalea sp.]|uniref:YbdD/YjiX family protein n=1 Tax=uncultured Aquitalea sp. TaxID=540272 RepID=UPI0025FDAB87|nr:CstA-like transporter-associated (seleno)protein [uncultured Aquitalea sp.]